MTRIELVATIAAQMRLRDGGPYREMSTESIAGQAEHLVSECEKLCLQRIADARTSLAGGTRAALDICWPGLLSDVERSLRASVK